MSAATEDELKALGRLEYYRQRRFAVGRERIRDRLAEALRMPDGKRTDLDEMILAALDRAIRNRLSADIAHADKEIASIRAEVGRRAVGGTGAE